MTENADPCAYRGHPRVHHAPARYWTDVCGVHGWRDCACTDFVEQAAEA